MSSRNAPVGNEAVLFNEEGWDMGTAAWIALADNNQAVGMSRELRAGERMIFRLQIDDCRLAI